MANTLTLQRAAQLYERHGRRLPPLTSLILIVVIALLLAQLVWALVPVSESARWQPPAVAAPSSSAARTAGTDINAIVGAQLFGSYQAEAIIGNAQEAPDTRLSLTLLGILAGSDRESRALIASSDGEEKPYAIGDDVVSGVSLQAIFPDRVILSRNGQLETLRLNRDAPSMGASAAPAAVTRPGATQVLGQIREQMLADPTKASEYIRVQPANVNGQLKGYRIYPGRERAPFAEAGLRPGDLVTSVNGIQLDDNQKALQMLGDLSQASAVTLTVDRGGQQQTINLTFN